MQRAMHLNVRQSWVSWFLSKFVKQNHGQEVISDPQKKISIVDKK